MERVIFDNDNYFGDFGRGMAAGRIAERDKVTVTDVLFNYSDSELVDASCNYLYSDYRDATKKLRNYLDGRYTANKSINRNWGNDLVACFEIRNGSERTSGHQVFHDLMDILDDSPSDFGNILGDYVTTKIWSDDGDLHILASRNMRTANMVVRQVTDEGERVLDDILCDDGSVYFDVDDGLTIMGRTYTNKKGESDAFLKDLFQDARYCAKVDYDKANSDI